MAGRIPSAEQDARRLRAIMLRAMRRARAELLNPPGTTEKARRFAEARAAARLRDLQADLLRLNVEADRIVDRQARARYERSAKLADRLAKDAGLVPAGSPIIGSLTGAETARAGVISRKYVADVDKAFASIRDVAGRSIREARALGWDAAKFKRLLAGGAVDGVPAATLQRVRKLAESIAIEGYVEIPNRNGGTVTRIKPTTYADLVYQTAMAEASNIATVERLVARGSYYVKIIGSNSQRFCTAYVGKVYYIGPGTDPLGRFPNLSVLPRGGAPFHPRCTKRYVPFNPATATAAELEAATPPPQVDAMNGKSSAEAQTVFQQQAAATPQPRPSPPAPRPEPAGEDVVTMIPTPTPAVGEPIPAKPDGLDQAVAAARRRFARDRKRPVDFRTVDSFEDVADALELSGADAERVVHASAPGITGVFRELTVSLGEPGEILVESIVSQETKMRRRIYRDGNFDLVVEAKLFKLAPELRGGIGSAIFAEMAASLQAARVARIETTAARWEGVYNGYFTWARLGYNAPLSSLDGLVREALRAAGIDVDNLDLLDLMASKSGRELWKRVGGTSELTFDLSVGSKSWAVLQAYLAERAKRGREP